MRLYPSRFAMRRCNVPPASQRHRSRDRRRGAIAWELMILGPAAALLSMAVSGAAGASGLAGSAVLVLLVYSAFRISGEWIRAR